ncbi:MAG: methylenetetrahydrofolate reductase [Bdellovibrionales bacterium]
MKPDISFEFFPPKSSESESAMWDAVPELAVLDPKFMTVTYGAGGTTKDSTLQIAEKMAAEQPMPIASHLTFLTTTREELQGYIEELWSKNVRHIVALRGDIPKGKTFDDFLGDEFYKTTPEFIADIVSRHSFEISVGAYPEKHPDAKSLDEDIDTLKAKLDAGGTRGITQFFFDNDVYYRFLEKCAAAGINQPVVPGLTPIHNFAGIVRFAKNCDANVPQWVADKFDGLDDKPEEARKVATEMLVKQSLDLAANGVEHIHYYTLNKSGITADACRALGYT